MPTQMNMTQANVSNGSKGTGESELVRNLENLEQSKRSRVFAQVYLRMLV